MSAFRIGSWLTGGTKAGIDLTCVQSFYAICLAVCLIPIDRQYGSCHEFFDDSLAPSVMSRKTTFCPSGKQQAHETRLIGIYFSPPHKIDSELSYDETLSGGPKEFKAVMKFNRKM